MPVVDILDLINDGKLDEVGALEIFDSLYRLDCENVYNNASLSKMEATAFVHGATFTNIAKFRYQGWPTKCRICGKALDVEKYGWWAGVVEGPGEEGIAHIDCLPVYPDEEEVDGD